MLAVRSVGEERRDSSLGEQYKARSPQLDWRASVSQRRTWLPSLLIGVLAGLGGIAEFILNRGIAIFLILIAVALAVLLVSPFAVWVVQWIQEAYRRVRHYPRILEALATAERDQDQLRRLQDAMPLSRWRAFDRGAGRALRARDQHTPLEIVGRDRDEGQVHLWFKLPIAPPIRLEDIIALRSSATHDLWIVLEVDQVEPDRCRTHAVKIFNQRFWERQDEEAVTDQSPPRGVEARLYTEDDLRSEVEALWREVQTAREIENG